MNRQALLINGRYLTRRPTGVDRFAIELLGAVSRSEGGLRLAVPAASSLVGDPPERAQIERRGRASGHLWEQIELPRLAGDGALVNLCNAAPVLRERQMVVIHDAGAVANAANYSRAFSTWYGFMLSRLMQRSRVVATVSRFSADELMRRFGRKAGRGIELLTEGGEHILRKPADLGVIERLGLGDRRFVLAVGSQSVNKNFGAVVAAVDRLKDPDILLVAAGGGDAKVFASSELDHPRLRRTGYVSDAELRALYEHALAFAFPSFYEGFGLPPLEAMCCGCPVVVSRRASLPEVCGDAALYCDPSDPATLATELQRLVDSPGLRAELVAAGRERTALFGWNRAARLFVEQVAHHFPEAGALAGSSAAATRTTVRGVAR